jgi:hypothetical protein
MHETTRRLGVVDGATCERLLAEALQRPFTTHARGKYGRSGPLRQGETAHIRELRSADEAVYQDNLEHFPVFRSFVRSFFAAEKIGKSYWHRLGAGRAILKHIDCGEYYDRTHRFQLFPRMDSRQVALLDGAEERFVDGTLVAFNPTVPHAYENRSDTDCLFLVFDLYPGQYALPY